MEEMLRVIANNFRLDFIILPTFLWFYYRAPFRRIDDTAVLMTAYGYNGAAWKKRLFKRCWRVPIIIICVIVAYCKFCLTVNPYVTVDDLAPNGITAFALFILFYPWIICWWANKAYYDLEAKREADLERRIAAGIANSNDIHGYIQTVKEREYNRGHSAGRLFP